MIAPVFGLRSVTWPVVLFRASRIDHVAPLMATGLRRHQYLPSCWPIKVQRAIALRYLGGSILMYSLYFPSFSLSTENFLVSLLYRCTGRQFPSTTVTGLAVCRPPSPNSAIVSTFIVGKHARHDSTSVPYAESRWKANGRSVLPFLANCFFVLFNKQARKAEAYHFKNNKRLAALVDEIRSPAGWR